MTDETAILDKLNPAQREAVTWAPTPLLVLAGAGSGKTRILTRRIAYLISRGARPFNVVGVTFTNKAAEEMRSRVRKLVRQDVWISTFHSMCLRILRADGAKIGLDKHFSIYDEHDQLVLVKECLQELSMNEKQVHPKGVRERIQRAKDYLMTPYQYAEKAPDLYEESVAKVYELYQKKLERLKACDFGDLIMQTVALFDRQSGVLSSWQDRFQHILIDEYQDTNHAQYRLVKLLAQARRQITVVGDPDQSIYAWRGADISNILNFEQDYPECGIIKMEQNYRSTSVILDAANELIKHNQMRKPKALWTERSGGDEISLVETEDEKQEALCVVDRVRRYVGEGRKLADQVVFYRVHAQSRILEDMLRRANLPYKIVGGVRFYDRREIKDLIAYLRVTLNPHDEVSLKRILNVPSRGLGKKAVETLEETARAQNLGMDEAIRKAASDERFAPKARKALGGFAGLLSSLRKGAKTTPASELLERVIAQTGYVTELEAEKTVEARSRIENIQEFFSVVEDFEDSYRPKEEDESPLAAFLESISLMTDLDTWDSGTDVLTLMTLHMAKGLEFPIVYMIGMEEGICPNVNAYTADREDLEEERRLCYVGITRAKDKLHMTYARHRRLYGSIQHNLPSRFLNEIPPQLMDSTDYSDSDASIRDRLSEDDIVIEIDPDEFKRRILFD